ncbi:MAG: hypothetical protein WA853_16280 [Candidatus Acidiferrum sp.]
MSAFQKNATCPFCHKHSTVDLGSTGVLAGLQKVRCSHCRKSWEEDFSEDGGALQKSAPAISNESLAALRASINKQFAELTKIVGDLVKKRMTEAARFHPQNPNEPAGVRKSSEESAMDLLKTARANRKPAGAFDHNLQPQGKDRFIPANMRKDFNEGEATELMKTARENGTPVR